jgi:hypothetical protein
MCDAPYFDLIRASSHKARKPHQCSGCSRGIMPGQTYDLQVSVAEGEFYQTKLCPLCLALYNYLQNQGFECITLPLSDYLADCDLLTNEDDQAQGRHCCITAEVPWLIYDRLGEFKLKQEATNAN